MIPAFKFGLREPTTDIFNGNVRVPVVVQELVSISDLFNRTSGMRKERATGSCGKFGGVRLVSVTVMVGLSLARRAGDALDCVSTNYHEITLSNWGKEVFPFPRNRFPFPRNRFDLGGRDVPPVGRDDRQCLQCWRRDRVGRPERFSCILFLSAQQRSL